MAISLVVAGSPEDGTVLENALVSDIGDARVELGTDAYRAVELAVRSRPDVLVVDPAVPGLPAAELVSRLKDALPGAPVVCWTAEPDVEQASELLRAGAAGYLVKQDGPAELLRQLPAVLDGGVVIAPKVAAELAARFAEAIHRDGELTAALEEASTQLQAIASAKEAFMANVNHELRTPVTIVKGIAHLLRSGSLSTEDADRFVERMDAAVEQLTGMIEEILSLADLGRGELSLHPEDADLADLLERVCGRVEDAYPEVVLERQAAGSFPVRVDVARISEAMSELLDNACRYSPPGGRVHVTLRRADEGVTFTVTDFGEGLHRDVLTQAFREPFVTGEEILRKERAGLGLGLHLARRLVVLHGGIMWADPLPSGGTRVAFCIPARQARSAPEAPGQTAPPPLLAHG